MILVTGATGLVGAHLLAQLVTEHTEIKAIYRNKDKVNWLETHFSSFGGSPSGWKKIKWFQADITDVIALNNAFEGVTKVYHAAARIRFDTSSFYSNRKINVEGTANVVNACLTHAVHKLVHISTIATLGTSKNGAPITEDTIWNPDDTHSVYALTKYGAELEVWRGAAEGLNVIIVHSGLILGEGLWGSGFGKMVRRIDKGLHFYPPGQVGVIDVKDVVKCLTLLMDNPLTNEAFVLVSENVLYKDILSATAKALNRTPPKLKLSKSSLQILRVISAIFRVFLPNKSRLNKATLAALCSTDSYSSQKITTHFKVQFTPLDSSFKRIAKSYLNSF